MKSNQQKVIQQIKFSLGTIIVVTLLVVATVTAAAFVNALWLWITAGAVLLLGTLIVRNHCRVILYGIKLYQLLELAYQRELDSLVYKNEQ